MQETSCDRSTFRKQLLPIRFMKILILFPCGFFPGAGYDQVKYGHADNTYKAYVDCEHTEVLNKKTKSLPSLPTPLQFGISFT
jgi:hypothetical protein